MGTFRLCLRMAAIACGLMGNIQVGHSAGALAIGACGAYGYARDYVQPADAETAARRNCAGDCKSVSVRKACAALAIDVQNACGAHGYAVQSRLGQAQNEALRYCYQYGGKDCVIRAWVCDVKG